MARLESTKRAKLKTAKQHQPSQKSKSLTCCYLLPRFWVTPYLVPIGTVDLKKKNVSIHKLFLSFPNKGGCSYATVKIGSSSPIFGVKIWRYLSCHHPVFQCFHGKKSLRLSDPWCNLLARKQRLHRWIYGKVFWGGFMGFLKSKEYVYKKGIRKRLGEFTI